MPCLDDSHPQGKPRVTVCDVNSHICPSTWPVPLGGPLESCAVTVRLRGVDTTVGSVYIRPRLPRHATMVIRLTSRLGRDYLLCGDLNAHQAAWESRRSFRREKDLMDAVHLLGLRVLNVGSYTRIRRTARATWTAKDVSLTTPGACYGWATEPDSWGCDHLPIVITPAGGKVSRSRRYSVVHWQLYRHHLDTAPEHQGFFEAITGAA
ncbi:hypothetical protein MTO96_029172 [Rhipicephalus appendiculatus]